MVTISFNHLLVKNGLLHAESGETINEPKANDPSLDQLATL